MKKYYKVLILLSLIFIAFIGYYREGLEMQIAENQCKYQYGEFYQLCAPIFPESWGTLVYLIFSWAALILLFSEFYKKNIANKKFIIRLAFDVVCLLFVIFLPVLLPLFLGFIVNTYYNYLFDASLYAQY